MLKVLDVKFLAPFVVLLVGLSCSVFESQETAENTEKELVKLPSGVQNAWEFQEYANESAVVLILTKDNELYQEEAQLVEDPMFDLKERKSKRISITKEQLLEKLKSVSETKETREKIVYLKVDSGAKFENLVSLLRSIRDAGISSVGLLTEKKPDWSAGYRGLLEVELQTREFPMILGRDMANPLTLVATLDESGNLKLNNNSAGDVSNTEDLVRRLSKVFKQRKNNNVFRAGTNEVEKTVLLEASGSSSYSDVVKLVDALRGSRAFPIVILGLDEPKPIPTIEPEDGEPLAEVEYQDNTNSLEE